MSTQVFMPQFGESVVEGTITKWLKTKGEQIAEYEPLLEVNTDKVDTEVPSPASGTLLDILVVEGTTVHAGTLLALIGEAGGAETVTAQVTAATVAPAVAVATAPALVTAPGMPAPGRGRDLGFISPVVAKIASEEGLDLTQIPGTGQGGRITKKDVLVYLEQRQAALLSPAPAQPTPLAQPAAPASPAPNGQLPAATDGPASSLGESDELLPLTPVRRAIADHMVLSKHTSAHVTTVMEVDLSRVVAHRAAHKGAFARDGVALTFTAYFVAATVAGLKAYPAVNASWSEAGLVLHHALNIGMATSLGEAGLIVPVIKHADSYSLLGLARTISDLATRARSRQLKPDEVKGGTFTITNHGINGSLFASPIINQPQCGILGVGKIQKRVTVVEVPGLGDTIAIRPMAYLSLTFDHRILDGAVADYFLGKVVESLEKWETG